MSIITSTVTSHGTTSCGQVHADSFNPCPPLYIRSGHHSLCRTGAEADGSQASTSDHPAGEQYSLHPVSQLHSP